MKNTLFIFLLFSFTVVFAQKEKTPSNLYINVAGNYNYRNYTNGYLPMFSPSFSLLIRPKADRMWEFGLQPLYFQRKEYSSATRTNLTLGFNVSYNWIFLAENDFPLKPMIGVGIFPYQSSRINDPKNSLTYKYYFQFWGAEAGLNLGFLYELKEKWLFSLTNPIGIGDFGLARNKTANPNYSIAQQKNSFFNFSSSIGFSCLKLGIARKI